jgi:hypothetical protein
LRSDANAAYFCQIIYITAQSATLDCNSSLPAENLLIHGEIEAHPKVRVGNFMLWRADMMKKLFSAVAITVAFAMPATAATLNGTFTIDIRNFSDTSGNANVVTLENSAATAANFSLQAIDVVITYTGDINFGIPSNGDNNASNTTIADFLASAGGSYTTASAEEQAFLNDTLLSRGNFAITTFFQITGAFMTDVIAGLITHDDGITLVVPNGQTGGISAPPTSQINTAFTAEAGGFTLFYAAANGNPSILSVDATLAPVPLPAGGLLLLGALGGIAALRRRKAA